MIGPGDWEFRSHGQSMSHSKKSRLDRGRCEDAASLLLCELVAVMPDLLQQ